MHRDAVLTLLRAHLGRAADAAERAMIVDAIGFAERHADCLLRSCAPGHFTGSAWIVSPDRRKTLLTHHHKLDKWLQLGGHADGEEDLLGVALREAREESGLTKLHPVSPALFDFDRHRIPPRAAEPGHYHYDLRFLIEADPAEPLVISSESKDLAWVEIGGVAELNSEESMLRMVRKSQRTPNVEL